MCISVTGVIDLAIKKNLHGLDINNREVIGRNTDSLFA